MWKKMKPVVGLALLLLPVFFGLCLWAPGDVWHKIGWMAGMYGGTAIACVGAWLIVFD